MNWIKTFEEYNNKLYVNLKDLAKNSKLIELDFESVFDTFDTDLEHLLENPKFLKELNKNNLVATDIKNTKDFATLINKDFKYTLLNVIDKNPKNKIQQTKYILVQENGSDEIKLFDVTKDLKQFFNKLTNKIIKITDKNSGKTYIYVTYNGGKNWELQNTRDKTNIFKKILDLDELLKILNNVKNLKIKVTN
jgi:hypothetical protein